MAWETIDAAEIVKFEQIGDDFEGVYKGSEQIETRFGMMWQHSFVNDKGRFKINGNYDLDEKISILTPSELVRIRLEGSTPTNNGSMKVFAVARFVNG